MRVTNLRVVEANVAATKLLGLVPGGEFFPRLADQDRRNLEAGARHGAVERPSSEHCTPSFKRRSLESSHVDANQQGRRILSVPDGAAFRDGRGVADKSYPNRDGEASFC